MKGVESSRVTFLIRVLLASLKIIHDNFSVILSSEKMRELNRK
ncbi:MAG: hypothetical protein QXG31_04360 [Candidatus Bathyarchaeia archaeon]